MNDGTDPMTPDELAAMTGLRSKYAGLSARSWQWRDAALEAFDALDRTAAEVRRLTDQLSERDAAITRALDAAQNAADYEHVRLRRVKAILSAAALDGVGQPAPKPEPLESPTHAGHEARDVSDDGYCYRCGEYTGAGQ